MRFLRVRTAVTILAVLLILAGGTYAYAVYQSLQDIPPQDMQPRMSLALRADGLEPNAPYLLSADGAPSSPLKSSDSGVLRHHVVVPFSELQDGIVSFSLTPQSADATTSQLPGSYRLTFDLKRQKIVWSGLNATAGSPLFFSHGLGTTDALELTRLEGRSDWAGLFQHTSAMHPDLRETGNYCAEDTGSGQKICLSVEIIRPALLTEVLMIPSYITGRQRSNTLSPFSQFVQPSECQPFLAQLSVCNMSSIYDRETRIIYDMTRMTTQLVANAMQQVAWIGMLMDARAQMETQLLFWKKQEEAYTDYHPSEQMCTFATFSKDLASAQARTQLSIGGLNRILSDRDHGPESGATIDGAASEVRSRLVEYQSTYCDKGSLSSTLRAFCASASAANRDRINRDLDYPRLIEANRTLNFDVTDGTTASPDEQDVLAMGRLLYNHLPLSVRSDASFHSTMRTTWFANLYQDYRSIAAMRSAARNTYSTIVGMKAKGSGFSVDFMRELLEDFGMPAEDIQRFMGDNPSYFAQMDVLTQKMYQNPVFYTYLITEPTNVQRFQVTMEAFRLMNDRQRYQSLLRREIALPLLVEMKLRTLQVKVEAGLQGLGEPL